jgi:heat shock protein HtpX
MAQFESLIRANKAKSAALVVLFILLFTGVIFGIFLSGVTLIYGWPIVHQRSAMLATALAAHGLAIGMAALCYFGAPSMVLTSAEAEPVPKGDDPMLHDVVEEMALASNLPPPAVYRMDVPSLNALAAGLGARKAAIVVTRGLRERLDRAQLQAVVAHELARVKNGDIRLMTLVAGFVGLAVLVQEFVKSLVGAKETTLAALGLLLVPLMLPILLVAPVLGRLIQLGVSRQRQFLADAEAARMTRYPEALAQALEIMEADPDPLEAVSLATAHLYVVSPLVVGGDGEDPPRDSVWSSHPLVAERVRRLRAIGNIEG